MKFLLIFLLIGCSTNKTVKTISIKRKVTKTNSGPTFITNSKFVDETKKFGLESIKSIHLYAVDFNNDGVTDIINLPSYFSVPEFYAFNKINHRFSKVKMPTDKTFRTSFLVFEDINKDGLIDMVSVSLNQNTSLRKYPIRAFMAHKSNEKIIFIEDNKIFPQKVYPTSSLTFFDYNLDGYLDAYVGNWFDVTKIHEIPIEDKLYLYSKGKFIDKSKLLIRTKKVSNKYMEFSPTFGTSLCDINFDGFPDIVTASSSGYKNILWKNTSYKGNLRKRVFIDISKSSLFAEDKDGNNELLGGGNSFYSICSDYNQDGLMDIAIGELTFAFDNFKKDRSSILTGISKKKISFLRDEYTKDDGTINWTQSDRRAIWKDIDFDGKIDLIVENSGYPPQTRLIIFKQQDDNSFIDVSKKWGIDYLNPSGIISLDINNDGKLDLIIGQTKLRDSSIKSKITVLINKIPYDGKRIVKFNLRGTKANFRGIGARVELVTNIKSYTKFYTDSFGGLPSKNEEGVYFSLRKGERLKEVNVLWPYYIKNKVHIQKYFLKNKNNFKKYKSFLLTESFK